LASAEFAVNNKDFTFHCKLQERTENGRGYKEERKGRESNGVCGKDEESTCRSRSGVEEDARRYKETSRQGKEGNRRLKERG